MILKSLVMTKHLHLAAEDCWCIYISRQGSFLYRHSVNGSKNTFPESYVNKTKYPDMILCYIFDKVTNANLYMEKIYFLPIL